MKKFLAIALIVAGTVACDRKSADNPPEPAVSAPAENTATVTETSVTTTDATATTSPAAPADAAAAPSDTAAPAATGTETTGTQQPQQ